eukprot:1176679-Prorocentrum_minimum.AAC.7
MLTVLSTMRSLQKSVNQPPNTCARITPATPAGHVATGTPATPAGHDRHIEKRSRYIREKKVSKFPNFLGNARRSRRFTRTRGAREQSGEISGV